MPLAYESTIYCDQPKEVLREIMQEAVAQYLASNPKASRLDESAQSITLKLPINLSSWGERLTVSVEDKSFRILSKSSTFFQAFDWGKNHDNVEAMRTCLESAMLHHRG